MSLFNSQQLSIVIGSAKILGSVTVSTPRESALYTVAVPRTQSHHLCVRSVSPDRHSLCWFQIHQGLPPVSQAFGLYSPCLCLVLSFPLLSPRAWPTIDGEVASFLIFSTLTRFMSLWINTFILLWNSHVVSDFFLYCFFVPLLLFFNRCET